MPSPIVSKDKCTGCNACCEICPMEILKLKEGKCTCIDPSKCIGCRACEAQCSAEAIKVKD